MRVGISEPSPSMAVRETYSTLELGVPTPQGQVHVAEDDHPPAYFDNLPSASSALPSARSTRQDNSAAKLPEDDFSECAVPPSTLPEVNFSKYAIPGSELSEDQTTQTIYSALLSSDPHELELFVQELVPLPPLLKINITGKIKDKVAFDIKCNMMGLIQRDRPPALSYVQVLEEDDNGYRGGAEPHVFPHPVGGGVEGWCRQFCEDSAVHKR